ncbi:tyrosine-type recombinase/integrase [Halovenus salina]|uniref:Tyrosine-type recombinase/integrase n=2 Tax=Halovenus salina TaxID=1510225 RepID=A0ABD5W0U3_9EURY
MTTPRQKYERRRETFNEYVENGEIDQQTASAVRDLLDAYDDHNMMVSPPEGEGTREVGTLLTWLWPLMTMGRERNLTTTTAHKLKKDLQRMHDGEYPHVKDDGIKKSTIRNYQVALRNFYHYHNFGIDPNDIPVFKKSASPVDPNDMLTKEEIQEAREAADNPRDRAIFELLLYTGQRREAIRTLRLKDVNIQEGIYRLNSNVDGLKGAAERNGKRPLLGAKGPLQNWLDYHPDTSDPDNYLITARPSYSAVDPSSPISGETIRNVMEKIKEKTSIKKPMHPHAMRHNFVTIAKRDYDLADDTIKYLIGHRSGSDVMETTYAHLSGDDHVQRAEEAWGLREPENESPLTPEVCEVCSNPLDPGAKACSRCGTVYTPDAKSAQELVEEMALDGMRAADDNLEADAVKTFRDF